MICRGEEVRVISKTGETYTPEEFCKSAALRGVADRYHAEQWVRQRGADAYTEDDMAGRYSELYREELRTLPRGGSYSGANYDAVARMISQPDLTRKKIERELDYMAKRARRSEEPEKKTKPVYYDHMTRPWNA